MKNKILSISLFIILFLFVTGCNKKVNKSDLNDINNQIIEYFQTNGIVSYDNYSFNYVDEVENVVVVGLINNSPEAQTWFKKNVVDSKLIKFVKGKCLINDKLNIRIDKTDTIDKYYKIYYETNNRKIYLASNIKELVVTIGSDEVSLKKYISTTYQTFEDSILSITNVLTKTAILKDGGTTIYKSKDKDITVIVCNTVDKNKDVYFGDYEMTFQNNICHKD